LAPAPINIERCTLANKRNQVSVSLSGAVAKSPCGSPSYSINLAPAIPLAAARPAVFIGTTLSQVPCITSVGIVKAVGPYGNPFSKRMTQATVALGLVITARMNVQTNKPSLTELLTSRHHKTSF
jgi:hypothetical protein